MRARTAVPIASAAIVGAGVLILVLLANSTSQRLPRREIPSPTSTDVQRGFAMPSYSRDGYASAVASRYLRQIVAVGATWVQLNPTWYQDGTRTDIIVATAQTPSDDGVVHIIDVAHRLGLKVFLKPLVDPSPDGSTYRGAIRPDDRPAWFASYTAFIAHYADMATRERVEQFALGTELAGVSADRAGWLGVLETVRSRYPGPVLYAANFDEYADVAFWDRIDLVGIDAYWPVSENPTADVPALQRAWTPIVQQLTAFADRTGRRVLFTEAGYTSQRGSTTAPWSWTTSTTADQSEQAAAYQALLASLSGQPWWAGVFWWAWGTPSPAADDPLGYSPHGKAAEKVVRRWWT